MAIREGAMIGGYLLPEEDFKKVIIQLLQVQKADILNGFDRVLTAISMNDAHKAYEEWDKIQTTIFRNPKTSLLAILNFRNGIKNPQEWVHISDEISAIMSDQDKNGRINIQQAKEIGGALREQINSNTLAKHLGNLFKTITSDNVEYTEESDYLFDIFAGDEGSAIRTRLANERNLASDAVKNYTYAHIIYGKRNNSVNDFRSRGRIADAFLNHLGNIHGSLFAGDEENVFHNISKALEGDPSSVKDEENNANRKLGFLHLLLNSLNKTGWYTGGDLIVTNTKGQVIANIQLKTSISSGQWIGQVRTSMLGRKIEMFKSAINSGDPNIAQMFYDTLKTSGAVAEVGDAVLTTPDDILKNTFNIKNINVGISI